MTPRPAAPGRGVWLWPPSGKGEVLKARSVLAAIPRSLDRLVRQIEEKVIALSVVLMALILIANVILRFFNSSLAPTEELSQFLIFFITFLGVSYAARNGLHIRMSLLSDALKGKPQKALALVVSLTTALFMFYVAWLSWRYVQRVGVQHRVSPILQWQVYYIYLVMPFGFFLTGLQYLLTFVRNLVSPGAWISYSVQHDDGLVLAAGLEGEESSPAAGGKGAES